MEKYDYTKFDYRKIIKNDYNYVLINYIWRCVRGEFIEITLIWENLENSIPADR